MILDALTILSGSLTAAGTISGQAVTGTNTSVLSTNTFDLGVARDIGKGEPLEVVVEVVTAAAGGTSLGVQLIQADDAALSVNVQVIVQTDAIATATLTTGKQIPLHYDRADPYPARRYIGLRYQIVGTMSAGAYFAAFAKNVQDPGTYYANGFAVL